MIMSVYQVLTQRKPALTPNTDVRFPERTRAFAQHLAMDRVPCRGTNLTEVVVNAVYIVLPCACA
jgi:hypothetical protein